MGASASSCATSLVQGSQLQLEALPNSGSEFRGWELDASSCGVATTCTLTISGGLTIAARFEVAAPTSPSTSKSTFTAAPLTISTGETSEAVVTAKDDRGTPLAGVQVALFPSGTAVTISPSSAVTDQSGTAKFSISGTEPGSATITASAGNVIIAQQLHLNIVSGGPTGGAVVATDDAFAATQAINQASTFAAPGVLANDAGSGGGPLQAQLVSGPQYGTVELHADGSFSYTPFPLYAGSDSFTYQASNGTTSSNTATVRLTVTGTQPVPTALCRDGTLSYSAHHQGTCSNHGGVSVWYR
jgi:hypothetical protein